MCVETRRRQRYQRRRQRRTPDHASIAGVFSVGMPGVHPSAWVLTDDMSTSGRHTPSPPPSAPSSSPLPYPQGLPTCSLTDITSVFIASSNLQTQPGNETTQNYLSD